jgi:hypothetical protein
MAAATFCSECGERLRSKGARVSALRPVCPRCSPPIRRARLTLIAIPLLCAASGFAIGRYTAAREPFYFIGTPIEISASGIAEPSDNNADRSSGASDTPTQTRQPFGSTSTAEAVCGARTRSGKACRRKVKGGGFCWQHRNKPGTKSIAPRTR